MSLYILIESATEGCSVAITDGERIISCQRSDEPRCQASRLVPMIGDAMKSAGVKASDCEAVAVSEGPGSYTGLRVGLSSAKGICFGASLKLIGINTLDILANMGCGRLSGRHLIIPMIDARRMEVYSALYTGEGERISEIYPVILDENSFSQEFQEYDSLLFIGDGAEKFCRILPEDKKKRALFVQCSPDVSGMVAPLRKKIAAGEYEDVAYFEPFYLKDFVAGVSKKSVNALFSGLTSKQQHQDQ